MIRARIDVSGVIQGVGFRPFIYRLANQLGLMGYVANTAAGVTIEVDGTEQAVDRFVKTINLEKPPLATIADFTVTKNSIEQAKSYSTFTIQESIPAGSKVGPVTPDSDVCKNCLAEMHDPADRRYLYPFINCTDCGPRYTLIEKTPFDRLLTSMKHFPMCADCEAEYGSPDNRRFHAQATCCPVCGPSVKLADNRGNIITGSAPLKMTADLLAAGNIIAIKGLGGFHLAVDAKDTDAIARLRERKGRPDKPLAVMAANLTKIKEFALFNGLQERVMTDSRKPIVLLDKKNPFPLSENIAPANRFIGVMLPYTPIHHLLFHYHDFDALVMTSGNLSGAPIVKDNDEAFAKLADIADYLLLHDRPIVTQADDSVIRFAGREFSFYRRARSYVPTPINLDRNVGCTLALGAIIKNTICLTSNHETYVCQHIGDLDNLDTQQHQKAIIDHFKSLLRIKPELLVHDLHPDYPGSRFASSQNELPTIGVQHHHAHAVSCMAEHRLAGPVIGLTLDGNGYGPDNTVWGGEVLLADYDSFERIAHLSPVAMPGGDAAIREPWRMAVSHLYNTFGDEYKRLDLLFLSAKADTLPVIEQMIDQRINAPLTSSCGRLFDAVAALLDLRQVVSFEGQAAAELEMLLDPNTTDNTSYPFEILENLEKPWQLLTTPIIRGVVEDILAGTAGQLVSRRFHNTLVALFTQLCKDIRDKRNLNRVVLSGGVFQNLVLQENLKRSLQELSFEVYVHRQVPANDGGLALGQAVAGRLMYEKSRVQGAEGSRHKG
jgi:hydrogenase maturation protein HypF